jgi:thiamine-phosphate pyrophosphorylase
MLRGGTLEASPVYRIIDSNLNRLSEGLRVLEELARMVLDDAGLTGQLKTLRHDLVRADTALNLELLQARNSAEDVGTDLDVAGEHKQKELSLIAVANARRVQESLRVLEEMSKLSGLSIRLDSERFKHARFEIYTLEKMLVSRLVRRDKAVKIHGLYVILDSGILNGRSHLEAAEQVIRAGVKVIQLRDKTLPKKQLLSLAEKLQALCRQKDVLFIINDYLDIALAVRADGLHIGQDDFPFEVARRLLFPEMLLGCSVRTAAEAIEAEAAGADYVAVGAVYPTNTKDDIDVVGVERLREVKKVAKTPLVAIGGINKNNALETQQAGADSLCVISAVLNAADMTLAARQIMDIVEEKDEKND